MTLRDWLLVLLANSTLVLGGIVLYDTLRDAGRPVFGVVDLASVYREKEEAFAKIVGSDKATEEERNKAVAAAQAFAKALPAVLASLSQECGCVVLMGNAVVSKTTQVHDLTPLPRARLGM
ncbi:MAG: TrbI F-type domain-containing protein [Hydrogenophilales bacterium]|nr:TrbI F-type domain-containing protein [Hydrogenophilales bacterium]